MILLLLAAATTQTGPQTGPVEARTDRAQRCIALSQTDPAAARAEATRWRIGGGHAARHCEALAFATEKNWPAAAGAFEEAARAAQVAGDTRSAEYWAQAGNAWLAAAQPDKARAALDSALTTGTLTGLQLGEARLDHARALVAGGDLKSARTDIDLALATAADDPLAWLLSATLARRMRDLPRAKMDIGEALKRSADDASVQLEAGNIAALGDDEAGARAAWGAAVKLAPGSAAGRSAAAALAQFGNK